MKRTDDIWAPPEPTEIEMAVRQRQQDQSVLRAEEERLAERLGESIRTNVVDLCTLNSKMAVNVCLNVLREINDA